MEFNEHTPVARGDGKLLFNKFPALCKYEMSTLRLTCILRTECGDEDTIGIRQEWIREFFLYVMGLGFRAACAFREFPCLKLPLFLSLGFVVAETIHGEVVLRETWIDVTETARLRRATRCTTS